MTFCASGLLLIVAVSLQPGTSELGPTNDHPDEMFETLRRGYLANREMFDEFRCSFMLLEGVARSNDDALKGDLYDVTKRTGLWIVKGARQRYELICSHPSVPVPPKPPCQHAVEANTLAVGGGCDTEKLLVGTRFGLNYSLGLTTANIDERAARFPTIRWTPFSLGAMGQNEARGPGAAHVTGATFRRYEGTAEAGGTEVHILAIGRDGVHPWSMKWFLDPDRGYLPVEARYYHETGNLQCRYVVTQIRRHKDRGFIPEKTIVVDRPQSPPPYRVHIIALEELQIGGVSTADFSVQLPKGTAVVCPSYARGVYALESPCQMHVDALPDCVARCRDLAAFRAARERESQKGESRGMRTSE